MFYLYLTHLLVYVLIDAMQSDSYGIYKYSIKWEDKFENGLGRMSKRSCCGLFIITLFA